MLLLSKAADKAPRRGPGPEDPVKQERAIGQVVFNALRGVVNSLDDATIALLDPSRIVASINWLEVGETLMQVADPLEQVITNAAAEVIPKTQLAKATLVLDEPLPIEFEMINQLAVAFAAEHSGALVMEISTKMRDSIATMLTGLVAGQLPRHSLLQLLRLTIPLHSAWAEVVDRVYADTYLENIESGASPAKADQIAQRRAYVRSERLLSARVKNIARSEAMRAMNEGKWSGWSQQIGDGWMPVDSLKEWLEGRSPCKECAPLVGEIRLWDEPFSNGQMMPPQHPSCRCTAALLPPDREYVQARERQLAAG
ncbi:MuF-like minor capsid protein [Microbacterium phage ValentiniPuff]|uniref:MuF-like minor capsid protein n=1 Tax=Microbacterium phage ValentiniPuff TaxID=2315705 RepID=A0A386KQ03_9CAUD|nr:MuF-like minor capsid protein [Microbacterium phage ValentiniPuff]